MNFVDRFSFEDFLGYLFPGTLGASGMYVILLATPFKDLFANINLDIFGGILFFIFSYAFGFVLSGISIPLRVIIFKLRRFTEPRSSISFPEFSKEIIKAYRHVFKVDALDPFEWSLSHFYLVRSLVEENMPNATRYIQRQDHLMMFREKLISVVLIWYIASIVWGIWSIMYYSLFWGLSLIIVATISIIMILLILTSSMYGNRKREVRELQMSFLAGYKTGAFDNNISKDKVNKAKNSQ